MNSELQAWTDQFEDWTEIRSALAVALYDAAHAAGITFPSPQPEVVLLHDPGAGSAVVPSAVISRPSKPEGRAEAAGCKEGDRG